MAQNVDRLESGLELLDVEPEVLVRSPSRPGVWIGRMVGLSGPDRVSVEVREPGGRAVVAARTLAVLGPEDVGCEVAYVFDSGAEACRLVLGRVENSVTALATSEGPTADPPAPPSIEIDGETLTISAAKQIVLRCGKASITLTEAGKVLIHGSYLSSHSTGINRVKGGAIQLN